MSPEFGVSQKMKKLSILLILFPFSLFSKGIDIKWLDPNGEQSAFWEKGTYRATEQAFVIWLEELPQQYPKRKLFSETAWFESQKLLKANSLYSLTSTFKLSSRKAGFPTTFMYVKGKSEEYGEGWLVFVGSKSGISIKSAKDSLETIKELWDKDTWGKRAITTKMTTRVNDTDTDTYENDTLYCICSLSESSIGLIIRNRSEKSLKIKWNESAIVTLGNQSSPVIIEGTRLIDKDKEIRPAVIAPDSFLHTSLTPTRNINWFSSSSSWHIAPLISESINSGTLHLYLASEQGDDDRTHHIKIDFSKIHTEEKI